MDVPEEEEEFGFEQGKAEIQELIQLANQSAHDARARGGGHAAKKEWWANRQQLDIRIKDFLKNVEMLWFGGFRGIFSQKPSNEKLLATFCSAFDKIMDKHLPSRRQRGKQKQTKLSIDPNVLDLFVKLDTSDSDENPEDLVMDLLYFVVDILQFHGERNAYDEVDFDMMVVEVMDAVKAYKDAEDQEMNKKHGHTIIVLDKELHGFPWESMEFLKGQSISRVPSLSCVTARLAWMQERKTSLDREKVSYVLNPGGDLKSTQANFESLFSPMPGWTGITNRSPSETEFESALKNSDVFLYFGHGSGAQYIRGRTIRRLDKCAVTFLMGCSSGILTEANQFEPYGTPMNYMQAGAGALVATLWDVTDKDIDRFTKTALERWGLVSGPTEVPSVGLDTAISSARDSCIFKYLNGAAPVVYGIPVFLG
ncbi:hypothetical protein KEM55_003681 [Ascosphaera atra]|nr:hypothetical protein KEM55_003681 [Ascosphaera atra]